MKLKKYDLKGNEVEVVEIDDQLLRSTLNPQLIKDYIVAVRNNARQWSANTKGRSEIALSNAKPHPQKGTGRARQGCIKTSQYRKGAVVFGPKPKFDQHVRINRKERRAAIHYLLSKKMMEGKVALLKLSEIKAPKTKLVAELLNAEPLKSKKALFLCDENAETKINRQNFILSMRNIPQASFLPMSLINGYDLMKADQVIVIDSAEAELLNALGGK